VITFIYYYLLFDNIYTAWSLLYTRITTHGRVYILTGAILTTIHNPYDLTLKDTEMSTANPNPKP